MKLGLQIGAASEMSVPKAVKQAGGMEGIRGIEIFDWDTNREPAELQHWLDEAGIVCTGVYFSSEHFCDPANEREVYAKAEEVTDFMQRIKSPFLVMNGGSGRPAGKETYTGAEFRQFAKAANRVADLAADKGIPTVMHPHYKCMIETTADVDALLAAGLDRHKVGLCVHAGHQYAKGVDPYEMYEKHAGWVRYLHIGDNTADMKGALLGTGVLDQKRLMNAIVATGYDGWVIIECKQEGIEPEEYVAGARAFLMENWPDLEWE